MGAGISAGGLAAVSEAQEGTQQGPSHCGAVMEAEQLDGAAALGRDLGASLSAGPHQKRLRQGTPSPAPIHSIPSHAVPGPSTDLTKESADRRTDGKWGERNPLKSHRHSW